MVCVVGGGITGLAAAYELTARGIPCRLFEASERLGGLIRTDHVDGFTIDAGADSMLAQKTAALDLCGELGLSDALLTTERPRGAFVLRGGRLFPLPAPSVLGIPATWRQLAGYTLLPWPARLRVALEPLVPRAPRARRRNRSPPFSADGSVRKPWTCSRSRCSAGSTPAMSSGCRCPRSSPGSRRPSRTAAASCVGSIAPLVVPTPTERSGRSPAGWARWWTRSRGGCRPAPLRCGRL